NRLFFMTSFLRWKPFSQVSTGPKITGQVSHTRRVRHAQFEGHQWLTTPRTKGVTVSHNLEAELSDLLGTMDWVPIYLTEHPEPGAGGLSIRQFFLALRDDEPMLMEFSAKLADQIIAYCLPRKRLAKAVQKHLNNPSDLAAAMAALRREARKAFQKYREEYPARSGEGGEMLAYVFVEHFLRAPMAIAKMHAKTNTTMPVFGADGVHVRYLSETDELEVIYLESKVHATIGSAARDASKSIDEFRQGQQRTVELRLALDLGNFDQLESDAQQALEEFLDPYSGTRTGNRLDRHACLLAYSEPSFEKAVGPNSKESLLQAFNEGCNDRRRIVSDAYKGRQLPEDKIMTFVLGLPSVADFRSEFEKALSNG
ncbi:HamA C-terminal domain-containing protein, partial [Burkholderia gladioli]